MEDSTFTDYEIQSTAEWIISMKLNPVTGLKSISIALQFPDELLSISSRISEELEGLLNINAFGTYRCYILGDTSFGSCCVDEVAAQHIRAQAIVHYGQACLSRTSRIPVYYVFGTRRIPNLTISLSNSILGFDWSKEFPERKTIIIVYDLLYSKAIENNKEILESIKVQGAKVSVSLIRKRLDGLDEQNEDFVECGGYRFPAGSDDEFLFLWVGNSQDRSLTNLMLNFNQIPVLYLDPLEDKGTLVKVSENINRTLMRRYYLIEKCMASEIIGIVVGTLGVERYLDAINRLKTLIKEAGKKYYLILIGKINDPKLANFSEIDIFVSVACPFTSIVDSSNFIKDVITPFEADIALSIGKEWTGKYSTEFKSILDGQADEGCENSTLEKSEDEHFTYSLVSRKMISIGNKSKNIADNGSDIGNTLIEHDYESMQVSSVVPSVLAERIQEKEFFGLKLNLDQREPAKLEPGLSGIARNYSTKIPSSNPEE